MVQGLQTPSSKTHQDAMKLLSGESQRNSEKGQNTARKIALYNRWHIFPKHSGGVLPIGCSMANSHSINKKWGRLQEERDSQTRRHSVSPSLLWYPTVHIQEMHTELVNADEQESNSQNPYGSWNHKPPCKLYPTKKQYAGPAASGILSTFHW